MISSFEGQRLAKTLLCVS